MRSRTFWVVTASPRQSRRLPIHRLHAHLPNLFRVPFHPIATGGQVLAPAGIRRDDLDTGQVARRLRIIENLRERDRVRRVQPNNPGPKGRRRNSPFGPRRGGQFSRRCSLRTDRLAPRPQGEHRRQRACQRGTGPRNPQRVLDSASPAKRAVRAGECRGIANATPLRVQRQARPAQSRRSTRRPPGRRGSTGRRQNMPSCCRLG